ncbi:MAG: type II secretion system F family protein [Planctomycetes bacterium]|nr:type II secretion system F family protein [Planctomycetota bacterium]
MPTFHFRARDNAGRPHQGRVEAASAALAVQNLRQRGWMPVDVKQGEAEFSLNDLAQKLNPFEHLPPRSVDIELSCKQMAVMLRGGLTLLTALQSVSKQANRATLRRLWERTAARIQEGAGFAEAMQETGSLPPLLIQLTRVGEQTGSLEQAVERAADTLERRRNLRSQLIMALSYPTLVLIASIGVTAFMVVGVIPKLKNFLEGMGRKLPAMTQFLVDLSDGTRMYLPHIAGGLLILTVGFIALYCSPFGRLAIDRTALRVPVIGHLFRLAGTASFARALGILVRSGITLLEGLRTAEELLNNRYLAGRVSAARQAVMQGGTLAEPLAADHAFTPMLARMVAVGESAGTIDEVLDEVARFHESQLQSAIRRLSAIIEPCIIVVVGGIVGFVYIAFFMALFSAGGA